MHYRILWLTLALLGLAAWPRGLEAPDQAIGARASAAPRPQPAPTTGDSAPFSLPLDGWLSPWQGDLDGMIARRYIRVLTTYNKSFYFFDNRSNPRGITYDTFHNFETEFNQQLAKQKRLAQRHLKVRIVFIPVARDELIPALLAGRGDIAAANLTITPDRLQQVDFTAPLSSDVDELVLSAPGAAPLQQIDDLAGKTVFVRRSSSYYESLVALNARLRQQQRPEVILRLAPEVLEDDDLIEMLHAKLIDYIVVDNHKAYFWQKIFPNIHINSQAVLNKNMRIGWAVRKNSPQLQQALNRYIAQHAKGSKVANIILQRYLANTRYVTDSVSQQERARFVSMMDFFKKYSAQYHIDWLIMTAQGYQESRLNQALRSKAGAIGVMQVMPKTGREMNVGDIRQLEPNIHAGIKYIRWMIDHFYKDAPMTELDKALFSFASYNAGPGRIAEMRKLAKQRGYRENVWFGNVEYIAAEKIGAETVTYVNNIYKYYIAYRLLTEHLAEKQKVATALELKP